MQTVHNLIILDASGSMQTIYNQALSGLNETIQTIKMAQKDNPEIQQVITLASFSSGPDYLNVIFRNTPAEEVRELTAEDYKPYGGTALYDAMGVMIQFVKVLVETDVRALVTIITDGEENSSQIYDSLKIREIIEALRNQNWLFTYIGANQNVVEEAMKLGIRSSFQYREDAKGTEVMFVRERKARRRFFDKLRGNFSISSKDCEEAYFED